MGPMYPTDITPDEESAGFRLVEIDNPQSRSNRPPTIHAVVRQLDESFRIVKVALQENGPWYNLEMYASFRGNPPHIPALPEPKWVPVESFYQTTIAPARLVEAVIQLIQQDPNPSKFKLWDKKVPTK